MSLTWPLIKKLTFFKFEELKTKQFQEWASFDSRPSGINKLNSKTLKRINLTLKTFDFEEYEN